MMFGKKVHRKSEQSKPRQLRQRQLLEILESRTMMSSTSGETMHTDLVYAATAANSAADIQGYTPAQIRAAYGFSNVSLATSAVSADGAGQTIAIVDAYNDPNIASDLAVFDSEFGIAAPPSLKVVSQNGSNALPATNADWDGEIALDVEWAHAIAPGANILLVEAATDDTANLMTAVNYARDASGVSVVSMSWGGSEFFNWGNGGESDSQLAYDADFATPSGHQGVTFVAAAGDSGSQSGVQWPASSSNVLSVGGTTLYLNSDGSYNTELGWSGTSSGYSQVESEPTYQDNVQDSGSRTVADVAYDADPDTGFPIYDSVADDGVSGWQEIGGTSCGAPQWAALVAIADQGRTLKGLNTLDGSSQTLPALYDLYGAPDSDGYATYETYFNDVSGGGGDHTHFRWGGNGNSAGSASPGYDLVTGLGSPEAENIVDALITTAATSTSGSSGSGGSSTGSSNPSELVASPLSATITNNPPASVIGGVAGQVNLKLTNTSGSAFKGPVSVTIYASTDSALSSDASAITTISIANVSEGADKSETVKLKFDYPADLSGSYFLIASVTAMDTDTATATAVTSKSVTIAEPSVDLGLQFKKGASVKVNPGHDDTATVVITNTGNVAAAGTFDLSLYASTDGALDESDSLLASIVNRKIKIGAGKSISINFKFLAPNDLTAGSYDLVSSISSSTTVSDSNSANNTATVATVPV